MAAPVAFRTPLETDSRAFAAIPIDVTASIGPHVREMPGWKRLTDILGAAIGLAGLAPLFLVVAAVVALESPGGPFFRQVRVGKSGRPFVCWKFRTMHRDAEALKASLLAANEANGHIFKMKNDPRRTRVGIVLRKTSIDELPQLWNVLKGEMSLVGPRPPIPAEVANYNAHELRRLAVEPGITGLWQVTLRGRHDFDDMVAADIDYAERRSPALDVWILGRTIGAVLKGDGSC